MLVVRGLLVAVCVKCIKRTRDGMLLYVVGLSFHLYVTSQSPVVSVWHSGIGETYLSVCCDNSFLFASITHEHKGFFMCNSHRRYLDSQKRLVWN